MKILITGGASGLGAAITNALAVLPDTSLFITYNASGEQADELKKKYRSVSSIHCDFSNQESVDALLHRIAEIQPDVLINNAISGSISRNYFHTTDPSVYAEGFQRNVMSVIRITQVALKVFRKQKSGKIITILSSALIGKPPIGWSAYVAEKNYLLSLSKSWATENARFNITANSISPSFMLTELNADMDERIVEEMVNQHPLKSLLKTEEVAEVVRFLIDSNSQLNGVNIPVNAAENVI